MLSVEDEVLANIRAQPIGLATVGDLGQPEAFQKRFADRVIVNWYSDRFRVVVADEPDPHTTSAPPVTPVPPAPVPPPPPGESKADPMLFLRIGAALFGVGLIAFLILRRRKSA